LEWAHSVRMSSWRDNVLAAEAKKAGSASEDTRLTLTHSYYYYYYPQAEKLG